MYLRNQPAEYWQQSPLELFCVKLGHNEKEDLPWDTGLD